MTENGAGRSGWITFAGVMAMIAGGYTLTSVIVGSQLLGIVGAFLAVPMVAVAWAIYNALEQPAPAATEPTDPGLAVGDA